MSKSPDVLVIGAGIVGAACACACAEAGLSVTLLDSGIPGSGATAAGMGHVVVMDDSDAQFALTRYSQRLWDEAARDLPSSAEFARIGTLWIAADEDEMAAARLRHACLMQRGVDAEILDCRALVEAEPALAPGLAGGLFVPGDSVVYPPCVVTHLIERLGTLGGVYRPKSEVVRVEAGAATLTDATRIAAGFVVLAAGQWTRQLLPLLPLRLRKGHLVITDRSPGFVRHQLVELGYLKSAHGGETDSVAFNIQPRTTGQMLLGSSRQYDIDDAAVDSHVVGRMIARAARYLPGVARLQAIRIWTGQRTATPDGLPLIGPLPGEERTIVATGHEGLGITTSLGTAQLVAAIITGRAPALALDPFLPSRFPELTHAGRD